LLVIVVIEDVLGKCAVVTLIEVTKPFGKLLIENSILLRSPGLVLLKLLERVSLWVI
jgi:hypothetical protein